MLSIRLIINLRFVQSFPQDFQRVYTVMHSKYLTNINTYQTIMIIHNDQWVFGRSVLLLLLLLILAITL